MTIYNPREDSFLLEKEVKKYSKDKKVLDMGTGSGIQARAALNSKAESVTAVDINKKTLSKIKENKIKKIHSNLFANVKGKFDLIIFNPPYIPDERENRKGWLEKAWHGGRDGVAIIDSLLKNVKSYLTLNGRLQMVYSTVSNVEMIWSGLREQQLTVEVTARKKIFFEELNLITAIK